MDETHYAGLARLLKSGHGRRALIRARGDEETAFLKRFIESGGRNGGAGEVSSLEDLRSAIQRCDRCPHTAEKKFGYGTGENGVMVILYPPLLLPGADRKEYKKDSAELLKKMLGAIELSLNECYITSLIKCEPDGALTAPSAMFRDCEEMLKLEISVVRPSVVVVMGDMVPLKKIMASCPSISWYCVDHPVSLIKNPELKRKAWNTLKLVRQKIDETAAAPAGS
ncbi:MAG TPA: hypothetical protein ENN21_01935 [Spirochaetes bacterium]|nr:hypothetical protein [Spirochaetota bacterium]